MYSTQEQKEIYIEKLFSDVSLFELDILHVSSNTDRVEVMEIIAHTLVHDTLKHELNFLHLHSIEKINFSNIKSSIFKQIISEWLTFCDDFLMYPKEDAIKVIKEGTRIKFIYNIVNDYFIKYQRFVYSEVIDTFFSLLLKLPMTKNKQILIEGVLQSNLNYSENSQKISKFSQVFNRIKIAEDKKKKELTLLNEKLKELSKKINIDEDTQFEDDNETLLDVEDLEYDIQELKDTSLYEFDEMIATLRENLISGMTKTNHTKVFL